MEGVLESLPHEIQDLIRAGASAEEVLRRIEAEMEETAERIKELSKDVLKGYIEWKWVLNKCRVKYWYWYYRWRQDGKLKSKYLGLEIPEWVRRGLETKREFRALEERLKALTRAYHYLMKEIIKGVDKVREGAIKIEIAVDYAKWKARID